MTFTVELNAQEATLVKYYAAKARTSPEQYIYRIIKERIEAEENGLPSGLPEKKNITGDDIIRLMGL